MSRYPQVIPVPPSSEPGPPSPWSANEIGGFTLDRVRAALADDIDSAPQPGVDESAVLGPLFEEDGETRIVLTRRASTLRSHRNEVSFPGGRVEPGEALVAAALREACEEIGLDPTGVQVFGTLTPLQTFVSRSMIHPFLGALPVRPQLTINPAEVAHVFDVSLADLARVHRSEMWGIGEVTRPMHFFELDSDVVWGATGRLLFELLARLTGHPVDFGIGPLP